MTTINRTDAERFLMNMFDRILMTASNDAGETTVRRIEEERATARAIIRNVRCCGGAVSKPRSSGSVDVHVEDPE